jgi:hypothetical protein
MAPFQVRTAILQLTSTFPQATCHRRASVASGFLIRPLDNSLRRAIAAIWSAGFRRVQFWCAAKTRILGRALAAMHFEEKIDAPSAAKLKALGNQRAGPDAQDPLHTG